MPRPARLRACLLAAAAAGSLLPRPTGAVGTEPGREALVSPPRPESSLSEHPFSPVALGGVQYVDATRGESATWLLLPTLRSLGVAGLIGVSAAIIISASISKRADRILVFLVGLLILALAVIVEVTGETQYESPLLHKVSAGLVGAAVIIIVMAFREKGSSRPRQPPTAAATQRPPTDSQQSLNTHSSEKFCLMMIIGVLILVVALFLQFLSPDTPSTMPIQVGCNACCGTGSCGDAWNGEEGQCCAPDPSRPGVCCPFSRSRLAVSQYQCVPPQGDKDWGCQLGPAAQSAACSRNTGGSCQALECDLSRGPTECIGGQCMCKPPFCALDGKCSKDACGKEGACSAACHRNTPGTCKVLPCHAWRNALCEDGLCVCPEGQCSSPDGECQPISMGALEEAAVQNGTSAGTPQGAQSSMAVTLARSPDYDPAALAAVLFAIAALAALAISARQQPQIDGRAPLLEGA